MSYPKTRLRRLRYNKAIRDLVDDTNLSTTDLIYPIFVCEGKNIKKEIKSMPGQYQLSIDNVLKSALTKGFKPVDWVEVDTLSKSGKDDKTAAQTH